jgi:adenosylcobinamide hydrolase
MHSRSHRGPPPARHSGAVRHDGRVLPALLERPDGPVLVWRFDRPLLAVSSGPLGGGIGLRSWVLNLTVPMSYGRRDPDTHLAEVARDLGLDGPGIGLMTGVDVAKRSSATDAGAVAVATVGLGSPAWAAAPDGDYRRLAPGTVNIVAYVPVRLGPAALVNAALTATEAKVQALWDLGVAATGTASDALCVLCPDDRPTGRPDESYGGPRSTWGARLARTVHRAVLDGGKQWLAGGVAWSDRQVAERGVPKASPCGIVAEANDD